MTPRIIKVYWKKIFYWHKRQFNKVIVIGEVDLNDHDKMISSHCGNAFSYFIFLRVYGKWHQQLQIVQLMKYSPWRKCQIISELLWKAIGWYISDQYAEVHSGVLFLFSRVWYFAYIYSSSCKSHFSHRKFCLQINRMVLNRNIFKDLTNILKWRSISWRDKVNLTLVFVFRWGKLRKFTVYSKKRRRENVNCINNKS